MGNRFGLQKVTLWLGILLLAVGVILAVINFTEYDFGGISSIEKAFSGISRITGDGDLEVNEEKVEAIKGIKAISVATVSDNITLIPVDSDRLRAHYYGSYSTSDPDYKPKLIAEKTGSVLNIKIEYQRAIAAINYSGNVRLDVYIPKQFTGDLNVSSTSARVSIEALAVNDFKYKNVSGNLNTEQINAKNAEIITTSGDVKISGVFESFKLNTVSGEVISDDFNSKTSTVSSVSGDVRLSGRPGDVVSKGTSGDLLLEYTDFDNNNIKASTLSGTVKIMLPDDSGFKLEYSTISGEAQCSFALSDSKGGKGIKGIAGNGGGLIQVNTVSGNLILK